MSAPKQQQQRQRQCVYTTQGDLICNSTKQTPQLPQPNTHSLDAFGMVVVEGFAGFDSITQPTAAALHDVSQRFDSVRQNMERMKQTDIQ